MNSRDAIPDPEELRRRIRSAFPAEPFFGTVTGGCHCDECTELTNFLRHQQWSTLDNATMDSQFGSLPLLSLAAFSAFLPAWLLRALDDLNDTEQKFREWTLYEVALYYDEEDGAEELVRRVERLSGRAEALTCEQIATVAAFLRTIQHHAPISDWDRESIARSLDLVWER